MITKIPKFSKEEEKVHSPEFCGPLLCLQSDRGYIRMEGEAQVTAVLTGDVGKERTSESSEEKTEAPFFLNPEKLGEWRIRRMTSLWLALGVIFLEVWIIFRFGKCLWSHGDWSNLI